MTAQLFGKLPAHGDFVARGLVPAARAALDGWLSRSLADAREALGDAFADRFDRALPWRGSGPGVAAAIAPSQDAAGRRFPVILIAGGDGDAAACEDLLYRAIGERWDADRLAAAAGAPAGAVERWCGAARALDGAMPSALLTDMLA